MFRSRLVFVLSVTAAAGLSGLAACNRSPSKSAGSTGDSTPRALMAAGPSIDTLLPGRLPMPLDSMSGDAFRTLVRGLRFGGGGVFKRPCTGNAGCDGPSPRDTTIVSIDAVRGQDSLVISRIPQNGAIAAVMINRGRWEEKILHLRSDSARYQYYLVVYPGASDSAGTWRIEEMQTRGDTASHRQISSGRFVGCMHVFNPSGPKAAFRSCAEAAGIHQQGAPQGATTTLTGYTSFPWVSCAAGCCAAQAG